MSKCQVSNCRVSNCLSEHLSSEQMSGYRIFTIGLKIQFDIIRYSLSAVFGKSGDC